MASVDTYAIISGNEALNKHPNQAKVKQEPIVPEKSARLNLDPDIVDKGVGGDGGEIRDDQDEGGNWVTSAFSVYSAYSA